MIVHASCVAVRGAGLLILGASGAGKSDLALRLIDRGAVLVADDRVVLRRVEQGLLAAPPARIAGLIEVRGLGIVRLPFVADVPVLLAVDLDLREARLPPGPADWPRRRFGDREVPVLGLDGFTASTAVRAELALLEARRHAC